MPCLLPKIYKKLIKNEMVLSGYINRSTYIVAKISGGKYCVLMYCY